MAQLAASPEAAVSVEAENTTQVRDEVVPQERPQRAESVGALWLLPQRQAMSALWALASPNPMPANLCSGRVVAGLACLQAEAKTWEALQTFDRPIVLEMVTPQRFSASVLLLGISDLSARVLAGETVVEAALADLGPLWTGSYRVLWQAPRGFSSPLSLGDEGLAVTEVALLFAHLDSQQTPLADSQFNAALKKRVVMFQRQYGLEDDGVIGVQTLLKLNELLGIDVSNARAIQELAVNSIEAEAQ
jgi:general secretion pathway protein A